MNDYVDSQDIHRISVKEFREKSRKFHEVAKKHMRLPFTRMVFVATVCSAYELVISNKKLSKFKIAISTVQKIWRDYSVKSLIAYWKEADRVIRASWPHSDLSRSHLDKWENFTSRYLKVIQHPDAQKVEGEVSYQIVMLDDFTKKMHMEDLLYLVLTIELM